MIIGYLGLIFLVAAYALLLFKAEKYFPYVCWVATLFLILDNYRNLFQPIVLANVFILIILSIRINRSIK
jgi:hypothetical protein